MLYYSASTGLLHDELYQYQTEPYKYEMIPNRFTLSLFQASLEPKSAKRNNWYATGISE